jgi:hypothetical protein
LGFVAGDNMILSEVGEFFNFWPTTVRVVLDADPIDLAVTANKRVKLLWGVPFEKSLIVFGDRSQFTVVGQNNIFAPKSVSADPIGEFDTSSKVPAVSAGDRAFFVEDHEDHSKVRELRLKEDGEAYRAEAVTDHVHDYVPANIRFMVSSASNQSTYVVSDDEPSTLYVYRWHEVGNQKAQQAWSKYTLADDIGSFSIFGMASIDDDLYVVWKDNAGFAVLTKLRSESPKESGIPFLDFAETQTGTITGGVHTDFRLHTQVATTCTRVVAVKSDPAWGAEQWEVVPLSYFSTVNSGDLKEQRWLAFDNDLTAHPCTIGVRFEALYEYSRPAIRDSEENPITTGRMQVRTWTTRYDASGNFEVRVNDQGGLDADDEIYSPGTTNGVSASGSLKVPVLRENKQCRIRVRSESPFDLRLTGAEYEAIYFNRASPIG